MVEILMKNIIRKILTPSQHYEKSDKKHELNLVLVKYDNETEYNQIVMVKFK